MAIAYLTQWTGPVAEATDPYPAGNWTGSREYPSVVHVQNVVILPKRSNRSDTGNIKGGLQQWGAAYSALSMNVSSYNNTTYAFYHPESAPDPADGGGHSVTIVGWNDTYPAKNFNTAPPADGAWIVKNSWGTNWGENGFFYVSYYDKYFGSAIPPEGQAKNTAFFLAEPVNNYAQLYSYDPLGECKDLFFKTKKTGTIANKFNVTKPGTIRVIGFYTTDVNTGYAVKIYHNPTNGPIGGTPASALGGTIPTMGYHTLEVPSGVPVQAGETFSVVLTLTNPTNVYYAAVEMPVDKYSSKATASPGESYYSTDSGVTFRDLTTDLKNANFCIKAYG